MISSLLLLGLVALAAARAPLFHQGTTVPGEFIVVMKEGVSIATRDNVIAKMTATDDDVSIQYRYDSSLNGFAVNCGYHTLEAIRSIDEVAYIEANQVVSINADESEILYSDVPSWGLNRVSERQLELNGDLLVDENEGAGVTQYVIDTGIYVEHNDFLQRGEGAQNSRASLGFWPANDPIHDDCNGHGTHVAGTQGGNIYGLAKESTLISVKVLGCLGSGTTANVIAGIDYTTAEHGRRGGPSVANMSLGGGSSAAMDDAVRASIRAGVTYAVAAGNSNDDACNGSPNRVAEALTVGSTAIGASPQRDERSSFSRWGTCVDIWAPGSLIQSAYIGGPDREATLSGTSMASPHVAGAAALYMGKHGDTSPEDIKDAFTSQATADVIDLSCPSFPSGNKCPDSPNLMLYSRL